MELNTARSDFSMSHNKAIYIAKDNPCLVIDSTTAEIHTRYLEKDND